jgi:Spore germination protein gerPA/gerPF.
MPTVNNIFNLKISSVSYNGSINFGNTLIRDLTVNQKVIGSSQLIGDGSLGLNRQLNNVVDSDAQDQINS